MLKWVILCCYCMTGFAMNLTSLAFASIAKDAADFFQVSYNAINLVSIIGFLCPFLGLGPAMYLADNKRFEMPYYLASLVMFAGLWLRVFKCSANVHGFGLLLLTQAVNSLITPFIGCLAPALSKTYFPKNQRAIAQSLGTIFSLLGLGAGLVISPVYNHDIRALIKLHAIVMSVPLILSVFCLDFFGCCLDDDEEPIRRSTSFGRLVRSMSALSTPSSLGFSPVRPEEHTIFHRPLSPRKHRRHGTHGSHFHQLGLPFVYSDYTHEEDSDSDDDDLERIMRRRSTLDQLDEEEANVPVPLGDDALPAEQLVRDGYFTTLRKGFCGFAFQRLLLGMGLLGGVVNAQMTLVSEAAPSSIDSATGAQLVCGLFFGCGTMGAICMGIIMDRSRAYMSLGRRAILMSLPGSTCAMLSWHWDYALGIYIGMAWQGFFGFGLLPLSIEYAIELTHSRSGPNIDSAVAGIVNGFTNIIGIVVVFLTTPGNLPQLDKQNIPFVWMVLNALGGIVYCTLPATYHRLNHEIEQQQQQLEANNLQQTPEPPPSSLEEALLGSYGEANLA